jgi:hypothetical protein
MAELTEAGYQLLRDHLQANCRYVEVKNERGARLWLMPITDPRCSWTHAPGARTLELTLTFKGSEQEPATIAGIALYADENGTTSLSTETFSQFAITNSADVLTIRYHIQVPKVA